MITLLRDPIERAISHYFYYRRLSTSEIHSLAIQSTLKEWVSTCNILEMDNGQVRRLSGVTNIPFGEVTSLHLAIAKENISRFDVVGVTEQIREFQILLHKKFGWPYYKYPAQNVGTGKKKRSEIPQETLHSIEYNNRYDLELYKYALDLLEQEKSKIDIDKELSLLESAPEYQDHPINSL